MSKKSKLLAKLAKFDGLQEMQAKIRYQESLLDLTQKQQQLNETYAMRTRSYQVPVDWAEWAEHFRSGVCLILEQQRQRTSISLSRVENEKLALLEHQKEKKIKEKGIERLKLKEKKELEQRELRENQEWIAQWFVKRSAK